ncbi:hypothetical protein RvY_06544 [Ramazzottius varieornatus]|uniref:Uncharacterized protein n=1 Tax=Ramazzottius varieornatus TaxID=947166 RepID=A0A1D1UZ05_RAMVA|nr:hypothetical protein RvY_06544 [Ramazzottius varieornatus]
MLRSHYNYTGQRYSVAITRELYWRNILDRFSQEYLQNCRYHPENEPLCPIFRLEDIVHYTNDSFERMAVKGGIIGFHIDWNCDLDYGVEACLPRYFFRRLDSEDDKIAKGWNFRTAYYYYDQNGTFHRDLAKYWGIRFVFLVAGKAGKFSTVHFILHVGSSLGLLGLASAMCEIFLSYHRSRRVNDLKFEYLAKKKPMKAQRRYSNMSAPQLQWDVINQNGHGTYAPDHRLQVRSASASPNRIRHTSVTPVLDRRIVRRSYGSKKSMFSLGNRNGGNPVWI